MATATQPTVTLKQISAELAEKHENIWATVGIHPTDAQTDFDITVLEKLAKHPKVVAVGECGLDYYWPTEKPYRELEEEKKRQHDLFARQIELARDADLPLMIHGRP